MDEYNCVKTWLKNQNDIQLAELPKDKRVCKLISTEHPYKSCRMTLLHFGEIHLTHIHSLNTSKYQVFMLESLDEPDSFKLLLNKIHELLSLD